MLKFIFGAVMFLIFASIAYAGETQIIKDRSGKVIGMITEDSAGSELKSPSGVFLGSYSKQYNETRDKRGTPIGKGNILLLLLRN